MFGIKKRLGRLEKLFTSKAIILMYHSISEPDIDPWELAVSPSNFEQQLQVLQNSFKISSVSNIAISLQRGRLKNKTVALTFDDGYRDNFQIATPLLEKYNVPATFFITNNFGEEKVYWWDHLANLILRTTVLPADFNIAIRDEIINYSIGEECMLNESLEQLHRKWVAPGPPPTKRSILFYKLWELMQPLPPGEIEQILYMIKKWTGTEEALTFPNTSLIKKEELRMLANHRLIDIGIHTVNHIALSYHSTQVQETEIVQNKNLLEQIMNRQITTIAYPYGEYNDTTLYIIKKTGIRAGVTVEYNVVNHTSNPFKLGRFQVKNWNAVQFEEKLIEWMKQ
jgi:peptidoglycan/xylan/chitin deacetylase (PgdA/CDA1 family)